MSFKDSYIKLWQTGELGVTGQFKLTKFGLGGGLDLFTIGHSGVLNFEQRLAFTGPKPHTTNSDRKNLGFASWFIK